MTYHLVRYYRTKMGLSKLELARLTKLTPRVIHSIESNPNHNPSRDTMVRISDVLGVPPSVIFFPKEEMEKRQMLSNMIMFVMDRMNLSEADIMHRLADMNKFTEHESLDDLKQPVHPDAPQLDPSVIVQTVERTIPLDADRDLKVTRRIEVHTE